MNLEANTQYNIYRVASSGSRLPVHRDKSFVNPFIATNPYMHPEIPWSRVHYRSRVSHLLIYQSFYLVTEKIEFWIWKLRGLKRIARFVTYLAEWGTTRHPAWQALRSVEGIKKERKRKKKHTMTRLYTRDKRKIDAYSTAAWKLVFSVGWRAEALSDQGSRRKLSKEKRRVRACASLGFARPNEKRKQQKRGESR